MIRTGELVFFAIPSAKNPEVLSSIITQDFIFLFCESAYVRGVLLEPGDTQAYLTEQNYAKITDIPTPYDDDDVNTLLATI